MAHLVRWVFANETSMASAFFFLPAIIQIMKFPAMFDYESVFVQISNNYPLLVRSNNPSISFLFPKKKIAKNPPWIIEMSSGFQQ